MKKYLLLILLASFVLLGCVKNNLSTIDVAAITDLPGLEKVVIQVSEAISAGTTNMEEIQNLVEQLQRKYVDFINTIDTTDQAVEDQFALIQDMFDKQSISLYVIPLRAKKLGMTLPQGMNLDRTLSQKADSGYNSIILIYTGDYATAMQQAQIIAEKAHLPVSKNFQQAQALAKVGSVEYISGLDIGNLSKGIVYINHELLDTNIDNLLSISVDQNGTLTMETTNYKTN